jgi:hypothetical protein
MKSPRWTRAQYVEYCKRTGVLPAPKPPVKKSRGPNQTEAAFGRWFASRYPDCRLLFESIKLRIDSTCWFLPDYFCPELTTFYEVKGSKIWDDAIVKFKACRVIHPWAKWEMWQWKNGIWTQIH